MCFSKAAVLFGCFVWEKNMSHIHVGLSGSYFLTVAKENILILFASLLVFQVIYVCLIYLALIVSIYCNGLSLTTLTINKIG